MRRPALRNFKLTFWDMMRARADAIAITELLGWQLMTEGEPQRTGGIEFLKRVRDRLFGDLYGVASCEFDSARTAAAYIAEAKAAKAGN